MRKSSGSLRMVSALALKYVPSPTRWVSTPMISNTFRACRSEARFTPNSFASSLSGGNLDPGAIVPRDISCLNLPMSMAVTRVSATGRRLADEGIGIGTANYSDLRLVPEAMDLEIARLRGFRVGQLLVQ